MTGALQRRSEPQEPYTARALTDDGARPTPLTKIRLQVD
jgi:hypothetical protein